MIMLPNQISHFFLCPYFNELARILFANIVMETIIILNVLLPVLKLVQSCLEHFNGTIGRNYLPLNTNSTTTVRIVLL